MPIAPQFNRQRNAITSALMNIANPPPRRPPMPQLAGPMQQPMDMPNAGIGPQVAPPGSLPQGMPPSQGMPPNVFPTPPTAPTPGAPLTPMAGMKGAPPQQGMMPQQPVGQTGQGTM